MILGIDLGTSNSLISFWNEGTVQLIPNQFGKFLTPSVVGIDENGEILIGEIAKERLITHPQLTASVFKRFIGTEKVFQLGKTTFSSIELSALILKSLKEDAASYLKQEYNEVVISVPAYFNNLQREATINAAELAGLTVKNLISEPTAAALAYGFHEKADQSLLVVDLGGGTYDVSLLELFDGVIQVEAISGDSSFGGEDFTQCIMQDFLLKTKHNAAQLTAEERALLYKKSDYLKVKLSIDKVAEFSITLQGKSYEYQLTQEEYKEICKNLIKKMRLPIMRVLNDAKMAVTDIDQIILIGGATKSILVREVVSKLFRKIPYTQINPEEAVALGSGIQAALKHNQAMVDELIMTDVCAHTLGVETVSQTQEGYIEGIFAPIIERNTSIPASKVRTFYTISDNQSQVIFPIYQGEQPRANENLKIGELTINIPPSKANTPIDCRFSYDSNGLLEVSVSDLRGNNQRVIIDNSGKFLTKEQIATSVKKMESLKIHPKDKSENRLLIAKLERLYAESTGTSREFIQSLLIGFNQVLQAQDVFEIQRYSTKLAKTIEQLERELWL